MRLTKEGQRVWNKLKKEGYTDKEIAEDFILPMEFESEEEKIELDKIFNEAREKLRRNEKR